MESPYAPVVSCEIVHRARGWCWLTVHTDGQRLLHPIARYTVAELRDVFVVDRVFNGPPTVLELVPHWGWIARASLWSR